MRKPIQERHEMKFWRMGRGIGSLNCNVSKESKMAAPSRAYSTLKLLLLNPYFCKITP